MTSRARRTPSHVALIGILIVGLVAACAPAGTGAVAAAVGSPAPLIPRPSATRPPPATSVPVETPVPVPTPTPSPSPTPVPTADPPPIPTPTPSPTPTPTPTGPFRLNLYGKGDFVSQATDDQCVSAAMQIMLNVVGPKNDRTKATQAGLARLAKRLSDARDHGTEPLGWARGLTERGAGAYEVAVEPSVNRAVRRAIGALRATGRPVGLLVWRGAHSWVLHGFETSADPALTDDYEIRGLWVSDPWYPRVSSIWGASRKPNQRITVKQLKEDYLKWRRPTGKYPGKDGKYVMVIPVD